MEKEIRYRVYYKDNEFPTLFFFTDSFSNVDDAKEVLDNYKKKEGFIEGHIKEETVTRKIIN